MKKSKLSESQIIAMLNEGEAGVAVAGICRKYQVSTATYNNDRPHDLLAGLLPLLFAEPRAKLMASDKGENSILN